LIQEIIKKCFYGFKNTKIDQESSLLSSLQKAFQDEFHTCRSSPWWPAWEWLTPCDWDAEVFADIQFGEFHLKIISVVQRLKKIADQICQGAAVV
jgi:hypothetical protein